MKLHQLGREPSVEGPSPRRAAGVNAFAGGGAMDVKLLGLHRKLTKRAHVMGLELALANHQRDSMRRVLDSFK